MGVDTKTLAEQVRDRQEQERLELERTIFFDDLNVRHAKMATEAENNRALAKKRELQELEFFRVQQVKEKQARARAEQDAKTAPELDTNFLKFDGVDADYNNRKKTQALQMRDWLAQQNENQRMKENRAAQEQADYEAYQARLNEKKNQLEAQAQANRAEEMRQTVRINQQLAAEKKFREQQERNRNQRMQNEELANTLSSALMTEDVGQRVMGGARGCTSALPYHFKGFSTDQRQEVLDIQQRQIQELQARRDAERAEEQRYHEEQEALRRQLLKHDRAREVAKQQERQALLVERSNQAKDQTLRTNYLKNVVYQNPVQEDYFGQFGTSCR